MHLNLILKNTTYNFVASYKSPNTDENSFLENLDSIVSSLNFDDPLFIIGDLNMDLLSSKGQLLSDFMKDHLLKNFIKEPTRITKTSSTLIDVLLHNQNLVINTKVVGCPYSDHSFTVGEIQLISPKPKLQSFWSRSYSEKNMLLIEEQILNIDFSSLDKLNYSNGKWEYLLKLQLYQF